MKIIFAISTLSLLIACKNDKKQAISEHVVAQKEIVKTPKAIKTLFTSKIEEAHKETTFLSHQAVAYDLELTFGGKPRMNATITQLTDGSKIKIEDKDGKIVYFDGNEVYGSPKSANFKGARFDVFTWSYFFALPYKLNDQGTTWSSTTSNKWGGADFETSKLTFGANIGDTPDDWYVIYKNPSTDLLEGAAYIVSFGKKLAKAEAEPHAIRFADFIKIDNVPFATQWTFHNWNIEEGYTDVLGVGKISNIKFVDAPISFSEKLKADSKLIKMPVK